MASSEIYSTWDDSAIRANVLAIISFTLNRVYTEWYRNMGYNFTVTNSTAYDQSFDYGRTIFEDISRIVDESFTTYIKRRDGNQPLFAQYSDGREVVREGCPCGIIQTNGKNRINTRVLMLVVSFFQFFFPSFNDKNINP